MTTKGLAIAQPAKDPDEWTTGDEPPTAAQESYLHTLATEAGETVDEDLTKAEASKKIDELQEKTGRGQGMRSKPAQRKTRGTRQSAGLRTAAGSRRSRGAEFAVGLRWTGPRAVRRCLQGVAVAGHADAEGHAGRGEDVAALCLPVALQRLPLRRVDDLAQQAEERAAGKGATGERPQAAAEADLRRLPGREVEGRPPETDQQGQEVVELSHRAACREHVSVLETHRTTGKATLPYDARTTGRESAAVAAGKYQEPAPRCAGRSFRLST